MKAVVALCLIVLVLEAMAAPSSRADREKERENQNDYGTDKRAEREKERENQNDYGTDKRSEGEVEFKRADGDVFKRSDPEFKRADGDVFKRAETCDPTISKWENGVITYAFCKSEIKNTVVTTALETLAKRFEGILTFNEIQVADCTNPGDVEHFIAFNNEELGCWSYIGKIGGDSQTLNLKTGSCNSVGVVMHEILHAIGLYHQQQRPDASQYIDINTLNIKDGKEGNFASKSMCTTCKYQTCSIMHYRGAAFSSNGKNTIEAKDSDMMPGMGKQNLVSPGDYCAIYLMYDALQKESECAPDICEYGTGNAYHFRCCRCNEHLEGADCGTFKKVHPDDSETVLTASSSATVKSMDRNSNNKYDANQKITHFVRAPKNCKIQVEVIKFDVEADATCYWDQYFYWATESVLDCPRTICGKSAPELNLTTESNFFMMAFVSDDMYQEAGFELKFTAVNCS